MPDRHARTGVTHAPHPPERTHHPPVTRAEIARSDEPGSVLARRYGVSTETVRKWRKRGVADCLDRSARPHRLPWKSSDEERAVVRALRRATRFAPDDLAFVLRHFLPHLNRDSIWRILRAEGLNRRPRPPSDRPAKGQGTFRDYDLGFVHIDIKHLPKLQTSDGERRKRYFFVAIEHRSRSVHLAVKDDETEASAIAFLREAAQAFPFRLTHVLTDNGSCFTPAFARVCTGLGAQYRHTRPRTPQTNGMVERFNGRVGSEVLGITIHSHPSSSSSCVASTPPTTPAASACWTAGRLIRSSPNGSKPNQRLPAPHRTAKQVRVTPPRPASSLSAPRWFHNQTRHGVRCVPARGVRHRPSTG